MKQAKDNCLNDIFFAKNEITRKGVRKAIKNIEIFKRVKYPENYDRNGNFVDFIKENAFHPSLNDIRIIQNRSEIKSSYT